MGPARSAAGGGLYAHMQRPRHPTGLCAGPQAAGFPSHSGLTLRTDVTMAAAAGPAVWRLRALGTRRGSWPRALPGPLAPTNLSLASPLLSSPLSLAQKACQPHPQPSPFSSPPPCARLRFPSINSRPNSIREGSFELLCLLGEMWAQEGSHYNFHFLKCLREHPGFLSPHQAGRWVRVSGLVTQLSPNKRSSQNPGERELPAIHDPCSR